MKFTNFIVFYLLVMLLSSCDPSMTTSYKIENDSSIDILIKTFDFGQSIPEELSNNIGTKATIYAADIPGNTGYFGEIARFDSIELSFVRNTVVKTVKWNRPSGRGFIIPGDGIEEIREDVPKDIYNRDNWRLKIHSDKEEWVFTIDDSDLELYQE